MNKRICSNCNMPLPRAKNAHSGKIGIPFVQCDACHIYYKTTEVHEYAILSSSAKSSFFVSFPIVLLSIFIAAIAGAAIYFFLPHIYAIGAIILAPIVFFIAKAIRKKNAKADIELSFRRCEYKGYLEFLKENGFSVNAKKLEKAKDYLELETSLELFGELTGYENFNKHFPLQLAGDYMEYMNSQLLTLMKQESNELTENKTAAQPNKERSQQIPANKTMSIPEILSTDISSIEKYIRVLLKKYNLTCSENKFQNIKIDVITYIEDNDELDKKALQTIIFNALKS